MISNTAPVRVNLFKQAMMRNRFHASTRAFGWFFAFVLLAGSAWAAGLDSSVQQLIVSIAPDWNASTGKLQFFERTNGDWKATGPAIPVLYGKNGLVWGRGVYGTDEPGTHKQEHDGRAPAGVFKIGTIYTYDSALPSGAKYPFHTVGAGDAWIDDVNSADYNKHVTVDPANPPSWFEKEKMKHGDFAYRWLVEIRHNSDPPVANGGSAIFFHIRRGPARKTAGCTTMAEDDLVKLIRWLRADKHPHYALLPRSEYEAKWKAWGLPSPQQASAVMP
jgi:L,D-peptidoglycan transpeptidase YkuD (ErfK/YbiS/YcfS/YnhG family)